MFAGDGFQLSLLERSYNEVEPQQQATVFGFFEMRAGGGIRTHEPLREQVLSLPPLATASLLLCLFDQAWLPPPAARCAWFFIYVCGVVGGGGWVGCMYVFLKAVA